MASIAALQRLSEVAGGEGGSGSGEGDSVVAFACCPWGTEQVASGEIAQVLKVGTDATSTPTTQGELLDMGIVPFVLPRPPLVLVTKSENTDAGGGDGTDVVKQQPQLPPTVVPSVASVRSVWSLRSTDVVAAYIGHFTLRPNSDSSSSSSSVDPSTSTTGGSKEGEGDLSPKAVWLQQQVTAGMQQQHIIENIRHLFSTSSDGGGVGRQLLGIPSSDGIVFRLTAVRREYPTTTSSSTTEAEGVKSSTATDVCRTLPTFTQTALAEELGEFIGEAFRDWAVSLRYFNVNIIAVYHEITGDVVLGLVLHEPNLPRMEKGVHTGGIPQQLDFWGKRRELTQQLFRGDVAAADVKHTVPPPGHFKNEVRAAKGMNAMHPALGHAMVALCGGLQCGDVVMDPLAGCGSTLVEALLANLPLSEASTSASPTAAVGGGTFERRPAEGIVVIGSELEHKGGVALAVKNLLDITGMTTRCRQLGLLPDRTPTSPSAAVNNNAESNATTSTDSSAEASSPLLSSPPHTTISTFGASGVLRMNALRMALRDRSVDIILSDLPFGARCGSTDINEVLYPGLMREFYRLLRKPTVDVAAVDVTTKEQVVEETAGGGSMPSLPPPRREGYGRLVLLTPAVDLVLQLAARDFPTTTATPLEDDDDQQQHTNNNSINSPHRTTPDDAGIPSPPPPPVVVSVPHPTKAGRKATATVAMGSSSAGPTATTTTTGGWRGGKGRRKRRRVVDQQANVSPFTLLCRPVQVDMNGQYPFLIVLEPKPQPKHL